MGWFIDLITNPYIVIGVSSWLLAQVLKMIIYWIVNKKFDIWRLFGDGGMPSGHSATVVSVATACACFHGFGSFQFAISGVLTMIVIRDASGVRRSAGEQAKLVNRMIKTLSKGGVIDFTGNIKEIVGHTPFQVFVGALVGIAVPFLMMLIMPVR